MTIPPCGGRRNEIGRTKVEEWQRHVTLCGGNKYSLIDRGLEIADLAGEKGTKALMITGNAFTLPTGTHERYEFLLKPVRAAEILAAVERALTDR